MAVSLTNEKISCRGEADLQVRQAEMLALPFRFEGPSYQLYTVLGNLRCITQNQPSWAAHVMTVVMHT